MLRIKPKFAELSASYDKATKTITELKSQNQELSASYDNATKTIKELKAQNQALKNTSVGHLADIVQLLRVIEELRGNSQAAVTEAPPEPMQGIAEAAAAVEEGVPRQTATPPLSTDHIQESEDKLASDFAQVFNTEPLYSAQVTDQAGAVGSSQTDGQTSVKSIGEVMGEPNLRSTPVSSQERPGDIGQAQEPSRFDVQKVGEKRTPPALNGLEVLKSPPTESTFMPVEPPKEQEQANQIEDLRQNPGAGRHLKTTSPDDLSNALDE